MHGNQMDPNSLQTISMTLGKKNYLFVHINGFGIDMLSMCVN